MVVEVMRVGIVDGYGVRFYEDRWLNPAPHLFTRKVNFWKAKTLLIYTFLSSIGKILASNFGKSNFIYGLLQCFKKLCSMPTIHLNMMKLK